MKLTRLEKILFEKPLDSVSMSTLDEVCINFDPVLSDDAITLLSNRETGLDRNSKELLPPHLPKHGTLDEHEQALQ